CPVGAVSGYPRGGLSDSTPPRCPFWASPWCGFSRPRGPRLVRVSDGGASLPCLAPVAWWALGSCPRGAVGGVAEVPAVGVDACAASCAVHYLASVHARLPCSA